MKLTDKLNDNEIMLLKKIDIEITDKDYTLQEIIDISDKLTLDGEISAVENDKNDIAKQYSNLIEKLINLEDE